MTSFTQYTDAKIIENILSGEIAQYEIFIRRNNPFLYKVGRSYNYNHEDTQDLMQESFIDAYKNLSKFENRSSFKSWIIKIMLNHCFRKKQKFSFKNEIVAEIMDSSEPMFKRSENDTYKMVANRELHCIIEKALGSVPFDYRMVFSLREMNGLNVSETAKALEISEANVKVRLNREKTMLRKEIEKSYSAEEIFEFNLIYCDAIVDHVMQTITEL
ncbi:MAG: sigma-70 family RNA polymerase sigma factor [Saprospiraceae bacterium]|nr:sigma-70 family RNA polymerase sigma factor [Candidatus Brachybacter algidus]